MSSTLPALSASLGWALLHFVWQGALLGALSGLGLTLLRNVKPQARYLFACLSLLACVLMPMLSMSVGLRADLPDGAAHAAVAAALTSAALAGDVPNALLAWCDAHLAALVVGWGAGVGVLALRLAAGLLWVRRLVHETAAVLDPAWEYRVRALSAKFALRRGVNWRVVANLPSPMTAGWWRPVVFVPAALLSGMPAELLEALLAHELAHVQRHDYAVNLLQRVIETLLFYHPAVWWISRQIRRERELIADELAARAVGHPRQLALALQHLERLQPYPPHLAQAAHGGNLMTRIKNLIRPEPQAFSWKAAAAMLASVTLCMSLYAHAAIGDAPTVTTTPDYLQLELKLYKNDALQGQPKVITQFGEQATILIDNSLKVAFAPQREGADRLALGLALYAPVHGAMTLLGQPRLEGGFAQEMRVSLQADSGDAFKLVIMPTLVHKPTP